MWEGASPLPHLFWWIAAQVLADDHRRKLHNFQRVGQVDECASRALEPSTVASKLACAGVQSAPKKTGACFATEREQAPSPRQGRSHILILIDLLLRGKRPEVIRVAPASH